MPVYTFLSAHAFDSPNDALSTAIGLNVVTNFVLFTAGIMLEMLSFTPTRLFLKNISWLLRFWPPLRYGRGHPSTSLLCLLLAIQPS